MTFGFALSGLQEFVYDLSPESQSRDQRQGDGGRETNAARRLRIRSALLTLAPAVVAWEIKRSDNNAKVVYLGGGKLLMASSKGAVESIQSKLHKLYDWLASASSGKLGAYWSSRESPDLNADALQELLGALGRAKFRAGRFNGWNEASSKVQSTKPKDSLGDRDWEAQQGADFGRRDDLVGFSVGQGGWPVGPWNVRPVTQNPDIALAGKAEAEIEVSIPTYTPRDSDGSVAELFKLAEEAEGAPYLALLKLDGDGIGNLMQSSLKGGLATYSDVSGNLTAFFGRHLMERLEDKHRRIYLVYSGGDDLVATGHFDAILRFAKDLQERYAELNLGTVSAGITVYHRNSPILKAVEAAEGELERAKKTRDAVSIGGCRMTWQDLKRTMTETDGLVEAVRHETINRGALQLLRQLGEPWLPEAPEGLYEKRWHSIPQLAYMRSRRTGWKENEWPDAVKQLFDSLQEREHDWPRAALMGTLAAWRTKSNKEDQ